jgi:hypothetical protein
MSSSSTGNKKVATTNGVKKFRRINLDMMLASTSLTRSSKESTDSYLQRVTHLHLQAKKIRFIEGLDVCTNLKVEICNISFEFILIFIFD